MFSRPQLRLLAILALLFAIAHASLVDAHIQRRQDSSSGDSTSGDVGNASPQNSDTSSAPATSGTGSTSLPASSTDSSASSSIPPSSTSTPTSGSSSSPSSTPVSSTPSSTPSSTAPSSTPTSTSPSPTSTAKSNTKTTSAPLQTTKATSVVVRTTVVDGSTLVSSQTSVYTTTTPSSTSSASLSSSDSKSSGMSSKTKNTVIGVVVGIGGAIVLAGLFIVAWRIWGRRKNEDESDGLMGYREGASAHEKLGSAPSTAVQNPFQTTLDQYHNQSRVADVSSNF